ncbi:hypothetical protein BCV70DRAFT_63875 [Testicularia cyperi]|uniref:Uncharacterized protein n=1 Tax=Testicularia cyperi TaxID=1882483 RepID=A0A317XVS4_9BASI|nr:hypothetical protein BCV70DRAFT_63875 [Testicularia cyperi]
MQRLLYQHSWEKSSNKVQNTSADRRESRLGSTACPEKNAVQGARVPKVARLTASTQLHPSRKKSFGTHTDTHHTRPHLQAHVRTAVSPVDSSQIGQSLCARLFTSNLPSTRRRGHSRARNRLQPDCLPALPFSATTPGLQSGFFCNEISELLLFSTRTTMMDLHLPLF